MRLLTTLIFCLSISTASCAAQPLHHSPLHLARESPFIAITIIDCYDGDTCTASLSDPWLPPVLGERIAVRLAGIDTPEIHGRCAAEIHLAHQARAFLRAQLAAAQRVDLLAPQRDKYFRLRGYLIADGRNLSTALIEAGLARIYNGGARQSWCVPS